MFVSVGNWLTLEFNTILTKYFQQLLKDLGNPHPHAIRNQSHWRAPILRATTKKITYRFYDLKQIQEVLEQQDTISLKKKVKWNGDIEIFDDDTDIDDPQKALLNAKSKAYAQTPVQSRIINMSNLVVGLGEGRATREVDIIWWPILYNNVCIGKMAFRLYVSRVQLV